MKDLQINEDFEVVLDHRKDLGIVDGRDAFEQNLALSVTRFFSEEIGSLNERNAKSRVRLQAERITTQSPFSGDVDGVKVEESDEFPNTLVVTIIYIDGELFGFEVS